MAFDIRAIFSRALGGRPDNPDTQPPPAPEYTTDEEMPGSPVTAAGSSAANPDTDDMTQGGATAATALIPEGMGAAPSASIDTTSSSREDDEVADDQARAVAEVAIAAALADGELEGEERDDLLETLREVPGLVTITDDDVDEIVARLEEDVDEAEARGAAVVANLEDELEELATTLSDPAMRRAAYQLAVYFAAWNGELSDDERDLLDSLAEAFEISAHESNVLRASTLMEAWPERTPDELRVL